MTKGERYVLAAAVIAVVGLAGEAVREDWQLGSHTQVEARPTPTITPARRPQASPGVVLTHSAPAAPTATAVADGFISRANFALHENIRPGFLHAPVFTPMGAEGAIFDTLVVAGFNPRNTFEVKERYYTDGVAITRIIGRLPFNLLPNGNPEARARRFLLRAEMMRWESSAQGALGILLSSDSRRYSGTLATVYADGVFEVSVTDQPRR